MSVVFLTFTPKTPFLISRMDCKKKKKKKKKKTDLALSMAFSLSENFQFLVVKFSIYLNRRVFVMPGTCKF